MKLTFKVCPDHWHFLRRDDEPVEGAEEGGHPVDGEEVWVVRAEQEGEVGLDLRFHLLGKRVGAVTFVVDKRFKCC